MGIDSVRKKIGIGFIIYGLAAIVLFGLIGLILRSDILSSDNRYYLALVLAFCLGIIHVPLLSRYIFPAEPGNFWKGLGFTLLLMLLGAAGVAILYYLLKVDYAFIAFIFPFFLPFLCFYTYIYFLQIPAKNYKSWFYPVNQKMPDLDMIDLSQIEVIQFLLSKKAQDPALVNFTSKAPLDMTLGQLFFIFINDYNEKNPNSRIEFLNGQGLPYGWVFYRKSKWFSNRTYFDPELSFRRNDIRPNELLYTDRAEGV